ncbi:hypothetical protein KBD18_02190, partial [Patescibacteria group bacterium]|nr:hypothetical protein [Patescibacteria group bacterium]
MKNTIKNPFVSAALLVAVISASLAGTVLWRGTADASLANGSLAKTATSPAVYFIWQGERYAFPNEKIFYSWYKDFLTVKIISSSEMADYRLRGNVTYKPSARLVKIQSDPKVYAVSKCGVLHGIAT